MRRLCLFSLEHRPNVVHWCPSRLAPFFSVEDETSPTVYILLISGAGTQAEQSVSLEVVITTYSRLIWESWAQWNAALPVCATRLSADLTDTSWPQNVVHYLVIINFIPFPRLLFARGTLQGDEWQSACFTVSLLQFQTGSLLFSRIVCPIRAIKRKETTSNQKIIVGSWLNSTL